MKICLLAPRFPFPENGGDVLRINSIARYLKSRGNELILISFCFGEIKLKKEYFDLYDTIYVVKKHRLASYIFSVLFALLRRPIQCGYYFSAGFLRQFRRTLKSESPDECVAHLLRMVPYLEKMKVQEKSVVEMTDALSAAAGRRSLRKTVYAIELGLIRKYERHVIQAFPKVVLVSNADIEYLKKSTSMECRSLCCHTNGVNILPTISKEYNRNKICFIGNMRTVQNQDAVLYFMSEVFPAVRRSNPKAEFHIVGAEPPERIRNLADGKSVFVTGFVESVEDAVSDSCVAVAPVRIAAGIQNKVLAAMGCGIPVVLTPLIAQAVPELSDGGNCLIRDTAKGMAEAVLSLMADAGFRDSISRAGYETVKESYSWSGRLAGYEELDHAHGGTRAE